MCMCIVQQKSKTFLNFFQQIILWCINMDIWNPSGLWSPWIPSSHYPLFLVLQVPCIVFPLSPLFLPGSWLQDETVAAILSFRASEGNSQTREMSLPFYRTVMGYYANLVSIASFSENFVSVEKEGGGTGNLIFPDTANATSAVFHAVWSWRVRHHGKEQEEQGGAIA